MDAQQTATAADEANAADTYTAKPNPWGDEQERRGVLLINRTYLARIPCGETVQVNRFDYNINVAAGAVDKYIQLEDSAWIKVGGLTLLTPDEQRAFIAEGGQS